MHWIHTRMSDGPPPPRHGRGQGSDPHLIVNAVAAALVGSASGLAGAQTATHELIPLPVIVRQVNNQQVPDDRAAARRINDRGGIIGFSQSDSLGRRAFAWFWCDAPASLADKTTIDLTALASRSLPGEAWDINANDIVVGYQHVVIGIDEYDRAFVWDLPDENYVQLGILAPDDEGDSTAYGINDLDPATVVGQATVEDACFENGPRNVIGFLHLFGDDPDDLLPLDPFGTDELAAAIAANNDEPVLAVGRSSVCNLFAPCGPDYDGAAWLLDDEDPGMLAEVDADEATFATDVNDAGRIVGYRLFESGSSCDFHALFWEHAGASPVDLGAIGGLGSESTQALGIQEDVGDGVLRVVGANLTTEEGLLWTKDGSSAWQVVTINSLLTPMASTVIEASDMNRFGWIVGTVRCGAGERAVLVRPLPSECRSDLSLDGAVGATDLSIMLGAWGTSPTCDARADIDADGEVDAADLAILLGDWSNTCICEAPGEGGTSLLAGGAVVTTEGQLLTALGALGFGSVAGFVAWIGEAEPSAVDNACLTISSLLHSTGGDS